MAKLNKEQISKNMQSIKSSNSKIERILAKALWKKGYRYRKNVRKIFGKPDIVFSKIKLSIFVDSEFWHGKNWKIHKYDHKSNKKYWYIKIEGNIKRDKKVNKTLKKEGWTVLRFWGKMIEKDVDQCIKKIVSKIEELNDL